MTRGLVREIMKDFIKGSMLLIGCFIGIIVADLLTKAIIAFLG